MLLSIGLLMGYTFLHWLLLIRLELFQVKNVITEFALPFSLAALLVLLWLRPRIQLLHLKRRSGDLPTFYTIVAIVAMGTPTVIAQGYLETATGKLTNLDSITQIGNLPKTKYYSIKNFYIDKKSAGIFQETTTAGKNNRNLVFTYYITCPIRVDRQIGTNSASDIDNASGPLYILDGEIIPAPKPQKASTPHPALTDLDKKEISSIQILKDTAAQRLYGTRGREGVVLISTIPRGFLAIQYSKTISNSLSEEEKKQAFEQFSQETQAEFEQQDLAQFTFLERMEATHADLEAFQISIQKSPKFQHTGLGPILIAHHTPFEARNGQKLPWVFYSIVIGAATWLLMISVVPLSAVKKLKSTRKKPLSKKSLQRSFAGFLPTEGFTITPILLYLNVLVFIFMVIAGLGFISFRAVDLLSWGANYGPAIQDGELWRLLSNVFLHGGLLHLFMNMYALLFIGLFLEPLLGRNRYVLLYLACGIAASLTSIWWYKATVSVGASGAIFGLFGFYLALLTTNIFPKEVKSSFLISIGTFIGFNLLYGLTGGVDNAAHIGGLFTGFALGYIYYFLNREMLLSKAEETPVEEQEQVSA